MTLPVSGPISLNDVNVELGLAGTTLISMNQASVRTLAGVPSGAISMQNLQGKANQFAFTISSNQLNANLRTLAVNAGWNQTTKVIATVGSGVWIYSNSTGTPALTVNGSFPGGVELVNNGNIIGMGGNGGAGGTGTSGSGGGAGGAAIATSVPVTIINNSNIGGGGGGGGGGGYYNVGDYSGTNYGGGGGGGGRTGLTNSSGGSAGLGSSNGSPGDAGTSSSAGAGGGSGGGGNGGAGGNWGTAGSSGLSSTASGGGGGAAGPAATGSSNITWAVVGNRFGPLA